MNFGAAGGFLFAADPHKPFDTQTIFWAPEALPTVLRVRGADSQTDFRPYSLHLGNADLRRTADGWHAVLRLGGATHRLWLPKLPKHSSVVIELPLDADFRVRTQAANRLWSALGQRALGRPHPDLSVQTRERLTLAIRAFDGYTEGNSYRAIAEGLFGEKRIRGRDWKTHDLRSRTVRLVQNGAALVRGGYRALFRIGSRE